jgi:hypothetical protein
MVKQDGVINTRVVLTGSEQVALARRGSEAQHTDDTSRLSYANPNAEYRQPQNIRPDYRHSYSVQPNDDQSQLLNQTYDRWPIH